MLYLLLILIPVTGAVLIAFLNSSQKTLIRWVAGIISAVELAFAVFTTYQFLLGKLEKIDYLWLPAVGSHIYFAPTGLGISLVILTALLTFLSVTGSFSFKIANEKLYFALLLILEAALQGVFTARDFLLFYIFWESVLIPMYFLIGIYGSENRRYAATKFFIYTFVASLLMLVGVFIVASHSSSLKFEDLFKAAFTLSYEQKILSFILIFVGFAVKLPVFPFHTWLPDAHVQAPTAASVLLAGVLLKMGGYGLFEILGPMYPGITDYYSTYIFALGFISMVYGALTAYSQKDIKKLVACSSVAHMGFVTAAFSAYIVDGSKEAAGFVMWAHGLITGMLFFLVGMAYERFHSRSMDEVKHLATSYPQLGWAFVFAGMASLGLPGLAGFIGEFLTGYVVFEKAGYLAALVSVGVFLNATYLLKLIRNVVFTPAVEEKPEFKGNLSFPEIFVVYVLAILIVFSGVVPSTIIKMIERV